jgi:hypothetical protein
VGKGKTHFTILFTCLCVLTILQLWNHYQSHTHPASERTTVVYGHDSKRGLNIEKYSKGLDSDCVSGGSLSALIIDGLGNQRVVSVECKRYGN